MKMYKMLLCFALLQPVGWSRLQAQANVSPTESSMNIWPTSIPDMDLSTWLIWIAAWLWLLLTVCVGKMVRENTRQKTPR